MLLQGTFTALITPFSDDNQAVDFKALEKIIEQQIKGGITGLVPCGTSGESPTLSHAEHKEVISKTVEVAKSINNDCIIIAGTGSNSTREAISLTKSAGKNGADYALVVNPYYNKPTQAGLYQHFIAVAEESEIPLVLYNIPGRTSVSLSIDTIVKLSEHENIVSIKEATGDLNLMGQIIQNTSDDFSLLSGDDNLTLPILAIGGHGVISVISNIYPQLVANIFNSYQQKDYDKAKIDFYKIFKLCQAMFVETNPIPVKYAAKMLGLCNGKVRLPLTELDKEYYSIFDKLIAEMNS